MFYTVQEKCRIEIFACDKINQSKGLIIIHDCNTPYVNEYYSDLMKDYNL